MIYDGVTFVDEQVKAMSKSDFIKMHINVFWTDKDKNARTKMLSDVYKRITGQPDAEETEKEQ